MKLSKELKKKMDREFRQYLENKDKLQRLENEKTSCSTRVILLLEERIRYVQNVLHYLTPFELEVFDFIFQKNYSSVYCATTKSISTSTYYNIYNKCLRLLAEEWGEI